MVFDARTAVKFMAKQSGYVLLLTLVFLQIVVIYSFLLISSAQLQLKIAKQQLNLTNYQFAISHALERIENQVMLTQPNCVVPHLSWDEMLQQPDIWWKRNGCQLPQDEHLYYFVVEKLKSHECLRLMNEENSGVSYYRVTVYELLSTEQMIRLHLQSTLAKRAESVTNCQAKMRYITPGRQGVRSG